MSNLTEWIKYELYPALYDSIDRAFPELNFTKFSGGWRSSLKLDLTNPKQKRTDKTVVSKNRPYLILEQGGDVLTYITYVERRDRVEFIQAVKTLADIVGLQLPKGDFNTENYQRYKDQTTLLEDCNSYFIFCLENSPGADKVKAYLSSRGYSDEDVKAMELGYIPDQDKLFKYLLSKGYTQSLIDEVVTIKTDTRIGFTHSLTLPWRSGGSIKGFKFRTIGDDTPKYLNTKGLDRSGGFFNLLEIKGDKDIVIVEGELDSLSATARGVDNIVATGGSSITSDQVKDAIRRGAKTFTICFDQEPGKEEKTHKDIVEAIKVIQGEGVNRVYIVTLPDLGGGKTDPDSLIKEKGVEAFRDAIKTAKAHYEYKLNEVVGKYTKLQRELTSKEIDTLLEEATIIGSELQPLDRDQFIKLFLDYYFTKDLGITQEAIDITVDKLQATKEKEAQNKELNKLLYQATDLHKQGETDKALELLDSKIKEVKTIGAKDLLPPPMSFNTLLDEIATIPPAYKTGYSSLDSFIGFTPGAITLIAGRPSHGKTTFMFNLLLQMSSLYQRESFYFFTYEEPVKNISVKLLNRLIDTDLSGYFKEIKDLPKPTNYEFVKSYIRAGRKDIKAVEEGKRQLQELIDSQRIKVIDRSYSVEQLSSLIAYLNTKEDIGAVFIDYIQRMNTERKTQDKRTEIAHISDSVLQIAKDSGLPIILGAQLNRATTESKGGKPKLENLKEAGNLEEDANTVISVYCKAREQEETENGEQSSKQREVELEIKTLKNREGEVNTTETLSWDRWNGVIKDKEITVFR